VTLRVDRVGGPDGITDTDLADLVRLRLAWKPASSPEEAVTLDRELRDWWHSEGDRRRAWLARHTNGYAVGMANAAVFTRMPEPGRGSVRWVYVANVFVRPDARRAGVGRALMESAIQWARSEAMVRIVLAPSEMSIPFHRALGFRPADDLARLDLV
jgi:GNAT superfamily N-acetyltransferase